MAASENTTNRTRPDLSTVDLLHLKNVLTAQYRMAIHDTLINRPVQTEIREFLHHVWAETIGAHAVHKGLDHPETLELKRTALELIVVNTALLRRKDRQHAMGKVPPLVKKLRFGMSLIGLSIGEQDQHIKKIGTNLTDAFLSEWHSGVPDTPHTERRSAKRMQRNCHGRACQKMEVEGLFVIDDDADMAWHLWESAMVELMQRPVTSGRENNTAPDNPETEQATRAKPASYWKTYPGDNL